jgi:hypothetical protein
MGENRIGMMPSIRALIFWYFMIAWMMQDHVAHIGDGAF